MTSRFLHPARNEAEGIAALFRGFQAAAGRKKDAVSVNNRINQRFLSSHLMKRRIRGAVYLLRRPSRRAASVPPCGVLPAVRCPSCRAPSVQPFASQVHFPRQGAHGAGSAPGIAFAARVFPPGGFNKSEAGRTQRKNSAAGRRATRFSCSGASFGLSRRLTGRFHL